MFRTLVQNFETQVDGLKLYDASDLTRVKIEGRLQTADYADFESVKKIVSATQNGNRPIDDLGGYRSGQYLQIHRRRSLEISKRRAPWS